MCVYFGSMLADKLNMSSDDAEKWIVNLIRNARLDAKIDSQLVSNIRMCRNMKFSVIELRLGQ